MTPTHTNRDTAALWRALHARLRAFIASRVANPEDADEILQTVFERAHRGRDRLRAEGALEGWLYQITRNAIVDHYRSRRWAEALPPDELLSDALPSDEHMPTPALLPDADDDGRAALARCLAPMVEALPEDAREILRFTDVEGATMRAAADRFRLSISGAKSRVQRARARLRETLLACCAVEVDARGRAVDFAEEGACRSCGGVRASERGCSGA